MKGTLRGRAGRVVVAMAAVVVAAGTPASADTLNTKGSGVVAGAFTYDAPGIPPSLGFECTITTFDIGLSATVAVKASGVYTGPVSFPGSGTSDDFFCDSTESGVGYVELSAFGVNAVGDTFECESLSGSFLRVYTLIDISLTGSCEINGVATPSMRIFVIGSWTPTEVTASGNVMKAEVAGEITFGFPL